MTKNDMCKCVFSIPVNTTVFPGSLPFFRPISLISAQVVDMLQNVSH